MVIHVPQALEQQGKKRKGNVKEESCTFLSPTHMKTEQKKKKLSLLNSGVQKPLGHISSSNPEKHSIKRRTPSPHYSLITNDVPGVCAVAREKWERRGEEWEAEFN